MPVIPYPRVDRALHLVTVDLVERLSGPVMYRLAEEALDSLASRAPRLAEWTEMVRSAKHILPRPRTSSDG